MAYDAGWLVTQRKKSGSNYIAINSFLKLPELVVGDQNTETYPEFFYFLEKNGYLADIGIGYDFKNNSGKWSLFANGNAIAGGWQQIDSKYSVYLSPGTTILFSAEIITNRNVILAIVKDANTGTELMRKEFTLASGVAQNYVDGVAFTRIAALASNASPSAVVYSPARYRFAKWYRGSLSVAHTYQYVTITNATNLGPYSKDGAVNYSHIATLNVEEAWPGASSYSCEVSSAGLGYINDLYLDQARQGSWF